MRCRYTSVYLPNIGNPPDTQIDRSDTDTQIRTGTLGIMYSSPPSPSPSVFKVSSNFLLPFVMPLSSCLAPLPTPIPAAAVSAAHRHSHSLRHRCGRHCCLCFHHCHDHSFCFFLLIVVSPCRVATAAATLYAALTTAASVYGTTTAAPRSTVIIIFSIVTVAVVNTMIIIVVTVIIVNDDVMPGPSRSLCCM